MGDIICGFDIYGDRDLYSQPGFILIKHDPDGNQPVFFEQ